LQQPTPTEPTQKKIGPWPIWGQYWAQYISIDPQIRAAATNQSVANPVTRLLNAERISTGISNQAFGNFCRCSYPFERGQPRLLCENLYRDRRWTFTFYHPEPWSSFRSLV
jgi:hypothetical protein